MAAGMSEVDPRDRVWWPCLHCDRDVTLMRGNWGPNEFGRWVHDRETSNPADHDGEPQMPAKGSPAQLEAWLTR
jgi:hypothetical protein